MKRLVLAIILSFTFCAWAQQAAQAPPLTIEAIYAEGSITGRGPESIKWSPDGMRVSFVQRNDAGDRGELFYVPLAGGKPAVLVAADKLAALAPPEQTIKDERERTRRARYSVAGYHWSPDAKYLLFDARGQLWLYTLDNGTSVALTTSAEGTRDPKFSPDGKSISYIRKHDIYVRAINGARERRITESPNENILNGDVDWVYAEELDVRSNYFWSPNSERIIYMQMDEEAVPTYPIVDWIPQHPTVDMMKYPKAGDPNPKVKVGVVRAGGGGMKWIELGQTDYIPRFGWVDDQMVWVQLLNRAQNKLDLWFINPDSGERRLMLSENSDAWVEVTNNFKLLKNNRFLWTSWRDGHTHIYLYSYDPNHRTGGPAKVEAQLTRGDFEVFNIEYVDEASNAVYFTANQGDARQRHAYKVGLDGSGMERVTTGDGSHGVTFAPNKPAFVDSYSAIMAPSSLALCRVGVHTCEKFWEPRSIANYNLVAPQFVEFKAEDGTVLYGTLLLPPNTTGKVPLILNPYGGPTGQVSRDAWGGAGFLFDQIMVRDGYAILKVDNRGMGNRGKTFTAKLMRNFGEIELKDQLASLKQVLERFPQLDGNRVGFWGWSYGGYMTAYALTHSDAFKAGIAGAPVTNWLDYDSIYTERYMGLPKENAEGYKRSSPVWSAASLKGRLLIIHGTSDDNVHMQNSFQFIDELIKAIQPYDFQVYPRKTHGVTGKDARTHLMNRVKDHFDRWVKNAGAQ